jgi:hypothetical protein
MLIDTSVSAFNGGSTFLSLNPAILIASSQVPTVRGEWSPVSRRIFAKKHMPQRIGRRSDGPAYS